jgi:uncharacterized protein YcbX
VPIRVSGLNRFPVKSCRGQALQEAVVEPWGLAGDRRWAIVDTAGDALTARELPRMLLIEPHLRADGGLELTSPDRSPLSVDVPSSDEHEWIRIHKAEVPALAGSDAAGAWLSDVIGQHVRMMYFDDPTQRRPNPTFALPSDSVSFADAYPLLLASTASLDVLNDWIAEGPLAHEGPLPMTRFRPNIVVSGAAPWEEDGWRHVRIGSALFRVVKGCDRCTMTMTDPVTAARGKEPIATLARRRRWDGEVWFAMNIVPDNPGVTIRVGDDVAILDSVPAPDGPPR